MDFLSNITSLLGMLGSVISPSVAGIIGVILLVVQLFTGGGLGGNDNENSVSPTTTQSIGSTTGADDTTDTAGSSSSSPVGIGMANIGGNTGIVASPDVNQKDVCAKYQDVSVCFYGEAKKMYNSSTGALSGTLAKAVAEGVATEKWHVNQLKNNYKSAPAFLLFATPADIQNTIRANVGAYACHMQVTTSGSLNSLNVSRVVDIIKQKAGAGDVCSGLLINSLGESATAQIFSGQGGSISFVLASATPNASFEQEVVHELSHVSDFKYNLSGSSSLYAQMHKILAQYYPKELSTTVIEQKLQDNNVCFGSALLLADRVTDGTTIIQPYNIASSPSEVFAYSATSAIISDVNKQLLNWLGRVTDVSTRNKCQSQTKNLLSAHSEYDINYGSQL